MMDKEAIMDSGLIERYVLGEVEDHERLAVEQLLATDEEVKAYMEEVENGLRQVAMDNAIAPPEAIKERMMMQVSDPVFMAMNEHEAKKEASSEHRISHNGRSNWPLAIAASLALLFLASSIWLYSQWQTSETNAARLADNLSLLENRMAGTEQTLNELAELNDLMQLPRTQKVVLTGNQLSPDLSAVAFIDHLDKEVFLNTSKLPALSSSETYQVWADVEGVMINMGVVSTSEQMLKLDYIDHAESMNVTIEPAGGSKHPTVERLVANVYL